MKEAMVAMEHVGEKGLSATIFYMDIRSQGKDFEKYYERAKEKGTEFIRSRVRSLVPLPGGDISLEYIGEKGEKLTRVFDMAVLSSAILPSSSLVSLSEKLSIPLGPEGFTKVPPLRPVETYREGIFVAGTASEPKDIPRTVIEASAAALSAAAGIRDAKFSKIKTREYPEERDITGEAPRIGVFVCHCGINIASVIDVSELKSYALTLPFVEIAEDMLFTCSADSQLKIKETIEKYSLNRVVVASCSPRTHEAMFRETLSQAGLNEYLFEMANIRDQDSWVHQKEPIKATKKARDLVRASVAKAALLEPARKTRLGLTKSALVVGGGAAGLSAALSLSEMGFPVSLIEETGTLGGKALSLFSRDKDIRGFIEGLIEKVNSDPLVTVYLNSSPKSSEGFIGNFKTTIKNGGGDFSLEHGVTILAPGGRPHIPRSYNYGERPNILVSLELDALLLKDARELKRKGTVFAFLLCAESRDEGRPYCSGICCSHSLEGALAILDRNKEAIVYVLMRDMRSGGFKEKLYEEARARGVRFLRHSPDEKPEITLSPNDPRIEIKAKDQTLDRDIVFKADYLILATGVDPAPMRESVAEVFKAQLNAEGFLLEAHMKLRPVDLATDGQFVAGLAHYPKTLEETIAQAKAAASKAAGVLSRDHILAGGICAEVDPLKCAACLTCVRSCPIGVPRIVKNESDPKLPGHAHMEEAVCQGCGVCVSECPGKAIKLRYFTDAQLLAKVGVMAGGKLTAGVV
jgi:heterodisulfide reductase subunit A-like polyferredoxin